MGHKCILVDADSGYATGDAVLKIDGSDAVLTVGAKVYEFHIELIRLAYHRSDTVVLQGSYSDWTLRMPSKEAAAELVAAWTKWEEQCPF